MKSCISLQIQAGEAFFWYAASCAWHLATLPLLGIPTKRLVDEKRMANMSEPGIVHLAQRVATYIAGHSDKAKWKLKLYLELVYWIRAENPSKNLCNNFISCAHALVALMTDMNEHDQLGLLRDMQHVWRKVTSKFPRWSKSFPSSLPDDKQLPNYITFRSNWSGERVFHASRCGEGGPRPQRRRGPQWLNTFQCDGKL